jgi:hypothetical protein
MVRLKDVQMYKFNEVPEHILEEMADLAGLMLTEWQAMSEGVHANLANGAWNFAHAAILVETLSEQFLHQGAKMAALSLVKNVELMMKNKGIPFTPLGQE